MSDFAEDAERRLQMAYSEHAEWYERALRLAAACEGTDFPSVLPSLLALLDEITAREEHLAPLKQRWLQAGRPAGLALRAVMDRIAALIVQIQAHVRAIEQTVRTRRDQLGAELDDCNRRRHMQRAYARKT